VVTDWMPVECSKGQHTQPSCRSESEPCRAICRAGEPRIWLELCLWEAILLELLPQLVPGQVTETHRVKRQTPVRRARLQS
jgi:hypothetical protein